MACEPPYRNAKKSAKLVFDKQVHPNICSLTLMLTDLHQRLDLLFQERYIYILGGGGRVEHQYFKGLCRLLLF